MQTSGYASADADRIRTKNNMSPHMVWDIIGQVVLEKTFKDFMILYLYIAQKQGQITHRGQTFDPN